MKNFIIPIFIPHFGCIHECIFCNQRKITGVETPVSPLQIVQLIESQLAGITKPRNIEVAFYGGSFTALSVKMQQSLLMPAYRLLQTGKIHAIRLSTRPDCVNDEIVNFLYSLGVTTIELGVQSLDDNVLKTACRGHTRQDVFKAVTAVRKRPIQCGLQLMPGLPGEDYWSLISTAEEARQLTPDFIRIYPTLVIAHTKLAELYLQGAYQPLSLDQAIKRTAYIKLLFERSAIKIIRTGLQATTDLADTDVVLAGPYHPAFGELVDSYLFWVMITQFFDHWPHHNLEVVIHHHPKDTSKIHGNKNNNLHKWHQQYSFRDITLIPDGSTPGEVVISYHGQQYTLNKFMLEHV